MNKKPIKSVHIFKRISIFNEENEPRKSELGIKQQRKKSIAMKDNQLSCIVTKETCRNYNQKKF